MSFMADLVGGGAQQRERHGRCQRNDIARRETFKHLALSILGLRDLRCPFMDLAWFFGAAVHGFAVRFGAVIPSQF